MSTTIDYLAPTSIIDSDNPLVMQYADSIIKGHKSDPVSIAIALYNSVRDDISYNPYIAYHLEESYRDSNIIKLKK